MSVGILGAGVPPLADVLPVGNDAGGLPITGLDDPTNPQDAATKAYVDGATPATPTLDLVLDAGEVTNAAGIIRAPDGDEITAGTDFILKGGEGGTAPDSGGRVTLGGGSDTGNGGDATLAGGYGNVGLNGGAAILAGNDGNDGPGLRARVMAEGGGAGGADGSVTVDTTDASGTASAGVAGQALVSGAVGNKGIRTARWGGLRIGAGVPAGAPDGELPLAIDTVTGFLYYWDGAAWVKVLT